MLRNQENLDFSTLEFDAFVSVRGVGNPFITRAHRYFTTYKQPPKQFLKFEPGIFSVLAADPAESDGILVSNTTCYV